MYTNQKDLIVLVADANQKEVIDTILKHRYSNIPCREIIFNSFKHPRRDPGVYKECHEFLRPFQKQYSYCLIIIDYDFTGKPETPEKLNNDIGKNMDTVGWKERYEIITIVPELEIWLWEEKKAVYEITRISEDKVIRYLRNNKLWHQDTTKPTKPKELLEYILKTQRLARSSSLYAEIAMKASIENCQDANFLKLRKTLSTWFPISP